MAGPLRSPPTSPTRSSEPPGPGDHLLEPARGPAARRRVRPRAARRGARRAVDADPAVADGRVRRATTPARRCSPRPCTWTTTRLREVPRRRRTRSEPFDDDMPLEARVERRPVPLALGSRDVALDLRLLMGRQWLKLDRRRIGDFAAEFVAAYPIHAPDPSDRRRRADRARTPRRGRRSRRSPARRMDGAKLYDHLIRDGGHACGRHPGARPARAGEVDDAGRRGSSRWFERLIHQPGGASDAWVPDRLEYQFAVRGARPRRREGAGGRGVLPRPPRLVQPRRRPGAGRARRPAPPTGRRRARRRRSMLPAPITLRGHAEHALVGVRGRPHELRRRRPDTTDLGKLLLHRVRRSSTPTTGSSIPFTLPAGVDRARARPGGHERLRRAHVDRGRRPRRRRGLAALGDVPDKHRRRRARARRHQPAAAAHGARRCSRAGRWRRSLLVRDEMANMVWGVERTIPLPSGREQAGPRRRARRALLLRSSERRAGTPPPAAAPGRRGEGPLPGDDDACPRTGSRSSRCTSTATTARSSSSARRCRG